MIFERIIVGGYEMNCYVLSGDGKECIIVDPGFEKPRIERIIAEQRLEPRVIINTHGHADHIGTNAAWGLPVWIGEGDADFLTDPERNLSVLFAAAVMSPPAARLLTDGEECSLCGLTFTVLYTPGHTPGGICLDFGDFIITGDTLFRGSVGRTDFPNGDGRAIIRSIKEKLMTHDDRVLIYPGHGPESTIGYERKHNFFLR